MDIFDYLHDDHRNINDMMEQLLFLRVPEKRMELFGKITQELLLLAETEQAVFYTALATKAAMAENIEDAENDHSQIKAYIDKLMRLSIEGKKWLQYYNELRHAVLHHVYKEEKIIFPKAKKILSEPQASKLAEEMDEFKQKKLEKAA